MGCLIRIEVMFKIMFKSAMSLLLVLIIACGNGDEVIEPAAPEAAPAAPAAAPAAPEASEDSGKRFNILATTPMIGEYVNQVAGQNVDVEVLMPYAVDPHTYEPSPKDVAKISDADLVFHVGIKYENSALLKLLENTVQTEQALIALGSKVNPIEFKTDYHDDHDDHDDEDKHDDHDDHDEHDDEDKHDDHDDHDEHDDEDKHDDHAGHDHGVFDPHFWFDPTRVALAVGEIKEELIKLDPENKNSYELSANSYVEKLKDLDKQIEALIQTIPDENRHIVTTHESLGYLESRYGLEVLVTIIPSVTTEDGVTPKGLVEVIEEIKEHKIKVIFLESESPSKSAEVIAKETNASLVSGLWVETLKENQSYIDFLTTNVNLIVENLKDK